MVLFISFGCSNFLSSFAVKSLQFPAVLPVPAYVQFICLKWTFISVLKVFLVGFCVYEYYLFNLGRLNYSTPLNIGKLYQGYTMEGRLYNLGRLKY